MKRRKLCRWIGTVLGAVLLIFIGICIFLCRKNPNPDRPEHIADPTGFVRAEGTNLYDEEGNRLILRGVNLGNWFLMEDYMTVSGVGDFETGVYTQSRGMRAMQSNPNLTDEQIEELYHIYMQTYMTEEDFKTIAQLGLNMVRVNFSYRNLTTDGETLREDGFEYLDWTLDMCEKYGLYAVLDLHGAVGSQNQDGHSGDDTQLHLYDSEENRRMTCSLWETIALRYKDRSVVAGYDLLNEPRRAYRKYEGKINTDFYDELYDTIRAVDPNHMIFIEYFTFPIHGGKIRDYGWENICLEYHIYNQTPLSQKTCLTFYKALHNLTGNTAPVYIGEWNAFDNKEDWTASIEFFESMGWSYSSWAYKTNSYSYKNPDAMSGRYKQFNTWGVYELYMEPVDLSTATFEELAQAYRNSGTEHAEKSLVYEVYEEQFGSR